MSIKAIKLTPLFIIGLLYGISCNNEAKQPATNKKDTSKKEDTVSQAITAPKPPIINITDTISPSRIILCMKDSAKTMERIGEKLAKIYALITKEVLEKNKLSPTGYPMAWYQTNKAPYFFEAGLAVAKVPSKLPKGVFVKQIKNDSAIVVHFFGPYHMLEQAYAAIKEKAKDQKINLSSSPYEIYIGDPLDAQGNPVDPYKVRTDIVFPRH